MTPGSKILSDRDAFEIDRRVLLLRVNALKRAIKTGLTEIEMVAAEAVFDKSLSAKLNRKARVLAAAVVKLDALSTVLARAKFPRASRVAGRSK